MVEVGDVSAFSERGSRVGHAGSEDTGRDDPFHNEKMQNQHSDREFARPSRSDFLRGGQADLQRKKSDFDSWRTKGEPRRARHPVASSLCAIISPRSTGRERRGPSIECPPSRGTL